MKLALFDLDNTLLDGDSDYGWGEYIAQVGLVDGKTHRAKNLRFYQDYQAGQLVMADYLNFQLAPLTQFPREILLTHRAKFVEDYIVPRIRPKGLAAINQHRQTGHTLIMITATNEFVTRPDCGSIGYFGTYRHPSGNHRWRLDRAQLWHAFIWER